MDLVGQCLVFLFSGGVFVAERIDIGQGRFELWGRPGCREFVKIEAAEIGVGFDEAWVRRGLMVDRGCFLDIDVRGQILAALGLLGGFVEFCRVRR
ncbi:Uncharacterised protein [Mycobacteroides abscessus subsp. abscessus]|nr:Uncharacterised protein [Mycobacteroides abscessus subsp. abscessus]SID23302.1 Uncharacterised protein [Mycobacteroides abscessus subsp. abscessus]